jgi:heme exporter protein C
MEHPAKNNGVSRAWKYCLLPLMLVVTVLAFTWLKDLENFPDPPTARIIIWHVPMAMLGMLWFWVGAFYAVRYLFGKQRGEATLDYRIEHANSIGLVCTILATVTGAIFALRQWQTPWNWDPKQVTITVLIVMYLAYFALRAQMSDPELRARISAVYSILGAVSSVTLTYIVPNLPIVVSLHPPGTTIAGGLDSKWRLVYWLATLGFLGITIWMFQLRLRLSLIEERLALRDAPTTYLEEGRTEAVRRPRLKPAAGE